MSSGYRRGLVSANIPGELWVQAAVMNLARRKGWAQVVRNDTCSAVNEGEQLTRPLKRLQAEKTEFCHKECTLDLPQEYLSFHPNKSPSTPTKPIPAFLKSK
uniref:RNase H domain-containing protein n=1 Tax=Bursaphelenchus xylophilus TaxID=6326 RepID=A0A1I7RZC5_BURXY